MLRNPTRTRPLAAEGHALAGQELREDLPRYRHVPEHLPPLRHELPQSRGVGRSSRDRLQRSLNLAPTLLEGVQLGYQGGRGAAELHGCGHVGDLAFEFAQLPAQRRLLASFEERRLSSL